MTIHQRQAHIAHMDTCHAKSVTTLQKDKFAGKMFMD